jgi:hypothetical protein
MTVQLSVYVLPVMTSIFTRYIADFPVMVCSYF